MKNKSRVHRLPSHNDAIKGQLLFDGKQFSIAKGNMKYGFHHHTPQHLYITTDEEIKEGDKWVYDEYLNKVIELTKELFDIKHTKIYRKIIATTDPKLFISETDEVGIESKFDLPRIPQSFIEEYCKAGGIDEVLVEYVMNPTRHTHLKLRTKDNCIIIHPVENNTQLKELMSDCRDLMVMCTLIDKSGQCSDMVDRLDKWIEENL